MDLPLVAQIAVTLLLGLASGVLAGLLGVGGSVLTTPGVRLLGASPLEAVGSTVPPMLPAALGGSRRFAKEGLLDTRIVLTCGLAGMAFALAGAIASDHVEGHLLMLLTAVLLLWSSVTMLRSAPGRTGPSDPLVRQLERASAETADAFPLSLEDPDAASVDDPPGPALPSLGAAGALSGFVAGLLGVGGGAILVPLLTSVLRVPARTAVASSLGAVAMLNVPALAAHIWLGHVDWTFAIPLMIGSLPGARIGSSITAGSEEASVRRRFGVFLLVISVVYGGAELAALL